MCSHIYKEGGIYQKEANFRDALCSRKEALSAGWPGVYPWHPDRRGTPPVMGIRNTNITSTSPWADKTDPYAHLEEADKS